jgi:cell division protein FtsB
LQPFVDNLAKMGHQFLALESENSRLEAENMRLEAENTRLEAENTRLEAEAVKAHGKYSTTIVSLLAVLDFIVTVYF